MNDLEKAIELNKESKQFRDEARELLAKTTRFNDQANINQRRLALAVSSLLPRSVRASFNLDEFDIDNTAEVAQENVDAAKQRDIFDIVHAINVLAMANTDILNINTQFRGHGNLFIVRARPISAISPDGDDYSLQPVIYREEVSLVDGFYVGCPTGDCPIQRLLRIESTVTELIIEAREEAESKCPLCQTKGAIKETDQGNVCMACVNEGEL